VPYATDFYSSLAQLIIKKLVKLVYRIILK